MYPDLSPTKHDDTTTKIPLGPFHGFQPQEQLNHFTDSGDIMMQIAYKDDAHTIVYIRASASVDGTEDQEKQTVSDYSKNEGKDDEAKNSQYRIPYSSPWVCRQ